MSDAGRAHAVSLPLFALMQRVEDEGASQASLRVRSVVQALDLDPHVEVVLVITKGMTTVGMEPKSDFGATLLRELLARSDFAPCPEGRCEYDELGACKWCGRIPRQ